MTPGPAPPSVSDTIAAIAAAPGAGAIRVIRISGPAALLERIFATFCVGK